MVTRIKSQRNAIKVQVERIMSHRIMSGSKDRDKWDEIL